MEPSASFPSLGPFLLVQGALGLVIVGSAIIAWIRGSKSTSKQSSHFQTVYLDGPIKVGLDALQGMYRILNEMREDNERTVIEFRTRHETEVRLLSDIKERLNQLSSFDRRR